MQGNVPPCNRSHRSAGKKEKQESFMFSSSEEGTAAADPKPVVPRPGMRIMR